MSIGYVLFVRSTLSSLRRATIAWMESRGYLPAERGRERIDTVLVLTESAASPGWVAVRGEDFTELRDHGEDLAVTVSGALDCSAVLFLVPMDRAAITLFDRGKRVDTFAQHYESGVTRPAGRPATWAKHLGDDALAAALDRASKSRISVVDPTTCDELDVDGLDPYEIASALGIDDDLLLEGEPEEPTGNAREWFGRLLDGVTSHLHHHGPDEADAVREKVAAMRAAAGAPSSPSTRARGVSRLVLDFASERRRPMRRR